MVVFETFKDKADVLKGKAGAVMSSVSDLNEIAIDKLDEVSQLTLSSAGYFSQVGIRQLRAATSIRDMDSLRKFTADSISLSGEIAKKVLDDGKAWRSAGTDMKDKVSGVFKPKEEVIAKKKAASKMAAA